MVSDYAKNVEITEFKDLDGPLHEHIHLEAQVNVLDVLDLAQTTEQEASSCKQGNELTSSMKNITMVNPAI